MSVSAKEVCKLLNELNNNDDGFLVGLLARFYVTDKLAEFSNVNCSKLEGSKYYSSSCLGLITALVDEDICYREDEDIFMLLSDFKSEKNQAWDKYLQDLDEYNKEHGTNHKPDKRPDILKGDSDD